MAERAGEVQTCSRCESARLRGHSDVFGSPVVLHRTATVAVVSVRCEDCGNEQTAEVPT